MTCSKWTFWRALGLSCAMAAAGTAQGAGHETGAGDMKARMDQLVRILGTSDSCDAIGAALDLVPGLVYGGTRPLPTKINDAAREGADEEDLRIAQLAEGANETIRGTVGALLEPLEDLALGKRCPDQAGQAVDVKFMLEETEDVAAALSEFTRQCALGDDLTQGRCAQLQPQIDEEDGHLFGPNKPFEAQRIFRGFAVKLRSPFVPRWGRTWDEDVKRIPALSPGQCAAVFKETKGLMLRLRYDGFTIVRDPWATPNLPRGTRIPIWTLEWVPSEYVKHFNVCNVDGRKMRNTVNQRIKQDDGLNFFWRYYPHSSGGRHH